MHKSQLDLERQMMSMGAERANVMMNKNEEKDRANLNPYTRPIYRKFIQPLAIKIKEDYESAKPSNRKAHIRLMRGLHFETTAYIAVRQLVIALIGARKNKQNNARSICGFVGRAVQSEQIMRQYKDLNPLEFFKVMERAEKRCSTDMDHRTDIVKRLLKKEEVPPIDWGPGNREQVGTYLVQCLADLGMVELTRYKKKRAKKMISMCDISFTDDMIEFIKETKDFFEECTPYKLPCVEKPHRYTHLFDGGYHSDEMKKIAGPAVIGATRDHGDASYLLQVINHLQEVSWSINDRVLDVAKQMPKFGDMEEIMGDVELLKPHKPQWLDRDMKLEDMNPEQKEEFFAWKKKMKEWVTNKKLRVQHTSRMLTVFRVAEKFRDEKEIFFCYEADFRGRVYPRTMGVNPQGSDLQKGMLHFSTSKPIRDANAEKWFLVHGANKAGYDKATLEDRVKWVSQHKDLILACAQDPINNDFWREVDCPFQFLAWCFEYEEYDKYGKNFFQSRLPISMDGSCNGLQNYSAAFRDEVGGKATNLIPGLKPEDIYTEVAQRCLFDLQALPEDENGFRSKWLKHGIKRNVVKRSVMTLPYGSTQYSAADFILYDYMIDARPPEFDKDDYPKAAQFLAKVLWGSIAKVVIKAREAMAWLQSCSKPILEKNKTIKWNTPNGFTVVQDYRQDFKETKIECVIFGEISLYRKSDKPCPRQHKNGIAPNFIHSLDAAHMQRVVMRAIEEGITDFAMIHDDFGTHAFHAERFNQIIREEFVKMYQEMDWFEKFREDIKTLDVELPEKPDKGKLDISKVLNSKYFFC